MAAVFLFDPIQDRPQLRPLLFRDMEGFMRLVREEGVFTQAFRQRGLADQVRVEQEHPARIGLPAGGLILARRSGNLPRSQENDRAFLEIIALPAI